MDVFEHPSFQSHEQVVFVSEPTSGLKGVIALHDTTLGPAAGGCRMHPYASTDDALRDALRLSEGMTLKNAMAGLPLGGGKCVVIADPSRADKRDLLKAMARHVQWLGGRYWTAIDVGVSAEDADVMAEISDYVFTQASAFVGDQPTAHYTALGGFHGVRAMARHIRGVDGLAGVSVAVQGVGQTGSDLIALLVGAGADVVAADVDAAALARVAAAHGVRTVAADAIHAEDVDVFAPCAMGGVLNDRTIPEMRCRGVAGVANNQLDRPEHGRMLLDRGIAYAPDFVVNAGGVIRASMPIYTVADPDDARERIAKIYDVSLDILARSVAERRPAQEIAEAAARRRIAAHAEAKNAASDGATSASARL